MKRGNVDSIRGKKPKKIVKIREMKERKRTVTKTNTYTLYLQTQDLKKKKRRKEEIKETWSTDMGHFPTRMDNEWLPTQETSLRNVRAGNRREIKKNLHWEKKYLKELRKKVGKIKKKGWCSSISLLFIPTLLTWSKRSFF